MAEFSPVTACEIPLAASATRLTAMGNMAEMACLCFCRSATILPGSTFCSWEYSCDTAAPIASGLTPPPGDPPIAEAGEAPPPPPPILAINAGSNIADRGELDTLLGAFLGAH